MKITTKSFGYLLSVILIIVIFFMQTCRKPCPDVEGIQIDTVWLKADTVFVKDTSYKPTPQIVYKDTGSTKLIIRWKDLEVDTQAIIEIYIQCMDTLYYADSTMDSNGKAVVYDTVYGNRIQYRRWKREFYPSVKLVTITRPEVPRNIFMLGGGVTGNQESVGFSIGAGLLNKKKQILIGSYDLLRKEIQVQYYIPIRFRKNK